MFVKISLLILALMFSSFNVGYTASLEYEGLPAPIRSFFDDQYVKAYELIADARHPQTGVYRDAYVLQGQRSLPSSVAATGVGLIALTIAHREGWEENVEDQIIQTLRSMNGLEPRFTPDREPKSGFFRHWIDPKTGARAWNSEYSTIDTALLVSGALFAANYFPENDEIRELALKLYKSVDWEGAVADPKTGTLYMIVDEDGRGKALTRPFNEYVIVMNLARLDPNNKMAQQTWGDVYAPQNLENMPQLNYFGHTILTDGSLLSSFVPQFVYYLVHEYTTSSVYQEYFLNAQGADKYDWNRRSNTPTYLWGHGAGTDDGLGGSGYEANAIGRNRFSIVSPYIIAGFLPVYPEGIYDLYDIFLHYLPYDSYENPTDSVDTRRFRQSYKYGLKRFSLQYPRWYPNHMSVIDWSSMLYGLAAFKHGMTVFTDYTEFDRIIETGLFCCPNALISPKRSLDVSMIP